MDKITIKQVRANFAGPEKLANAVVYRVGLGALRDIRRGGIEGGFHGFTYHRETVNFFNRHKADIVQMVGEHAEDSEGAAAAFVEGLIKFSDIDGEVRAAIYRLLAGKRAKLEDDCDTIVAEALAWWVAGEVAEAAV